MSRPETTSSQDTSELEFHISSLGPAVRPQVNAGTSRTRRSAARACAGSRVRGHRTHPGLVGAGTSPTLNRGGNRTVNAALHTIAITQAARGRPGKDYIDKLQAAGKTRREALRLLRRRLSDRVFRVLRADESTVKNVAEAVLSEAA